MINILLLLAGLSAEGDLDCSNTICTQEGSEQVSPWESDLEFEIEGPMELIVDWPKWKAEISKDNGKSWQPSCFVQGDRLRIWVDK